MALLSVYRFLPDLSSDLVVVTLDAFYCVLNKCPICTDIRDNHPNIALEVLGRGPLLKLGSLSGSLPAAPGSAGRGRLHRGGQHLQPASPPGSVFPLVLRYTPWPHRRVVLLYWSPQSRTPKLRGFADLNNRSVVKGLIQSPLPQRETPLIMDPLEEHRE